MKEATLAAASQVFPPLARHLWRRARRHVGGRHLCEVVATAEALRDRGAEVSVDVFGTSGRDEADVRQTTEAYAELPATVWRSVDLSHVGLRWSRAVAKRAATELAAGVPAGARLQVGAEEAALTDEVLAIVRELATEGAPVMATVQANLLRSPVDADALTAQGIPIRLVKGAFRAGTDAALPPGQQVDRAFYRLACRIQRAGGEVSLATHDRTLRNALFAECGRLDCEVSFGVRDEDIDDLVADGVHTRVYVPFGPNWLRFYLRRLAEAP